MKIYLINEEWITKTSYFLEKLFDLLTFNRVPGEDNESLSNTAISIHMNGVIFKNSYHTVQVLF